MAEILDLNVPAKVTLDSTSGNVTRVLVPGGTSLLYMASAADFYIDGTATTDGAAGTPADQFKFVAGTLAMGIEDSPTETVLFFAGDTSSQELWILARGSNDDEIVAGEAAAALATYYDEILRFLPEEYRSMGEILAAPAASLAEVRGHAALFLRRASVSLGAGIWLTLHGRGLGIYRNTDETDAALRQRIRNVDDRLTRPAILAACDALFAAYTTDTCAMYEWFDGPALDDDGDGTADLFTPGFHLDNEDAALLLGGAGSFLLVVPRLSGTFNEPVYSAVIGAVEDLRAAGTSWLLRLAEA